MTNLLMLLVVRQQLQDYLEFEPHQLVDGNISQPTEKLDWLLLRKTTVFLQEKTFSLTHTKIFGLNCAQTQLLKNGIYMSEKLTENGTFRCTSAEKLKATAIGKTRNQTFSEYIRALIIADISQVESYVSFLSEELSLSTHTVDTFRLELAPRPIRDVTPKHIGTKKVQLREQLDFLAIQNLSHE